jgi:hypothetical protein
MEISSHRQSPPAAKLRKFSMGLREPAHYLRLPDNKQMNRIAR